jgi:hypothetical protein
MIYFFLKIVEYVHQYSKLFLNNDTKNTSRSSNENNRINTDTIFSNSN